MSPGYSTSGYSFLARSSALSGWFQISLTVVLFSSAIFASQSPYLTVYGQVGLTAWHRLLLGSSSSPSGCARSVEAQAVAIISSRVARAIVSQPGRAEMLDCPTHHLVCPSRPQSSQPGCTFFVHVESLASGAYRGS